jgi:hypothetical protein
MLERHSRPDLRLGGQNSTFGGHTRDQLATIFGPLSLLTLYIFKKNKYFILLLAYLTKEISIL